MSVLRFDVNINRPRRVTVNSRDSENGMTALMAASVRGHYNAVKFLIEKGADVNHKDNSNATGLMGATEIGNIRIVKLLVENNADVHVETNSGNTAIILAASHNDYSEIVEYLLTKKLSKYEKNMALTSAANWGSIKSAKLLIESGADVNFITPYDDTPLMLAAACSGKRLGLSRKTKAIQLVKLLLDNGANLDAKSPQRGMTALMCASEEDLGISAVKLLLENGANPKLINKDKETALDLAKKKGNTEIIRVLEAQSKFTKYVN